MDSGIDIVQRVYHMLNVPQLINALDGGGIWQHGLPLNSDKTEVCIRIPTTDAYESELRFFDIDIRTPNLPEAYPAETSTQDNTLPDLTTFDRILDIILPLIETQGTFYVETKIPGVPMRDPDGMWRVNIRVEFTLIDTLDTHTVTLLRKSKVDDGYGGYTAVRVPVWTGSARREDIVRTPNLVQEAGVYKMHMRCSWLIPKDEATPQKPMVLTTGNEEYLITGIFPEGVFWRVTATRKDGPYE